MENKDIKIINTVRSDSTERIERLIKIARKGLLNPRVPDFIKKELRLNLQEDSYRSKQ